MQLHSGRYPKVASAVRRASDLFGYKLTRVPRDALGIDPFRDMRHLSADEVAPVIIDAGANVGQSVHRFKSVFPSSRIHSFEPTPTTYMTLRDNVRGYSDVYTSNTGLGSTAGEATLLENSHSDMNSFLRPGALAWGRVAKETSVTVDTVDDYCARTGISAVEILKTDTQGFDLEVVKGSGGLIRAHRLHMIYMEVIFGSMYQGVPPCYEVLRHLINRGFQLVCFYQFHFQNRVASWSDALFIDPAYS